MATLTVPPKHTNPREDATNLHNALKGSGSDTAEVVNILTHRDATQRAAIQRDYKILFQQELKKSLSSQLSGHMKKAVLLWMPDPVSRDVTILRHALTGTINDVKAATEVICSRTPFQLHQIKQAYYSTYSHNLDHDIGNHTSGDHKKLLLAYVNTSRYEGPEIDGTMVEGDALSLYNAGERKLGTDEKTFISIFSDRSKAHLTAVCSAYHRFGRSLEKAVKHKTSGHFRFALLTILRCAENPGRYFAKLLRKAIKGMVGTDDSTLIRIVVTRCEVDLQFIKFAYRKKYGKLLHDSVHSVTSGHYRAFLRALLGPTH